MRLRPELVLLQKTMMTVEGVARRIDPEHDIWGASEPVVKRWIARELSPVKRIRQFAIHILCESIAFLGTCQAERLHAFVDADFNWRAHVVIPRSASRTETEPAMIEAASPHAITERFSAKNLRCEAGTGSFPALSAKRTSDSPPATRAKSCK